MPKFNYSHYIGWSDTSPANKVEVEAFSDRGAQVKTRKILSSMRIIWRREPLENIRVEVKHG